ncbi:response regulator [Algicella marina]|uniref:Response regulator n=1 Tax=Algicella marina TaxID=2683284 RepID=A0A6P1T6L1_9RHOB|nr:response regulator [Algicella marina]QHQ37126.1 response regulator [Algicella marina]
MSATEKINRLMLIDDNAIDQKMYQRIIARSGRVEEVVTCLSAMEALDYLDDPQHPKIDVILLDINMPRVNGFQFLEEATVRFGTAFTRLVVVMLTTSLDPRDAERARSYSVVRDFLNKPLSTEHLDQIARYLEED